MSIEITLCDCHPEIANRLAHTFWVISLSDWVAYYEDNLPAEDSLYCSIETDYQRRAHESAKELSVCGDWFNAYPRIDVSLQVPNGEVVTDVETLDQAVEQCLKFWGPEALAEISDSALFSLVGASMGHGTDVPDDFVLFKDLQGFSFLNLLRLEYQ